MNSLDLRTPDTLLSNKQNPRYCVAVVGCTSFVGASYVAGKVVKDGLLSGNTPAGRRTLVELGKPHFYSALGMEKRFMGREFSDFPKGLNYKENLEMGINWYLLKPGESLSEAEVFRAIYTAPGNLVVFDCSGLQNEAILFDILPEMNEVYLVLDPMPSRLLLGKDFMDKLLSRFPKTELVVNKFSKGIHRSDLSAFLGSSNYTKLPALPIEDFYKAEYNCVLP